MALIIDDRVREFILSLPVQDQVRIERYFEYFEEFGFRLHPKYLKKVADQVWELRPGRARIFLYKRKGQIIVIHATVKESKKIKPHDLDLIRSRVKEWQTK